MPLSVVTVNWNSREDLAACLESLVAQTHQDLEVIIIDNASEDGSVAMVQSRFPQFTLLPQTTNLGFAEGCNVGIAHASGDWIALLNNDAVADPHWAEALVAAAARVPESCGMLQSLMLFQQTPPTVNSTGIKLTKSGGGRDRSEGDEPPAAGSPWEPIFCPTGGAAAYRRSMLDAIKLPTGYFDAPHFCYYEDMDLGWRARLYGYDALYIPESIVHHKYHGSTARRSTEWHTQVTVTNRARTLLKNASWPLLLRTAYALSKEFRRLWSVCGREALPQYFQAVRQSLELRSLVEHKRTLERRAIERRWAE
jgi:GT2 family glycosyltransferase